MNTKSFIIAIICIVIASAGVTYSIAKLNKTIILSPNTVTVYDSLKNVIAYKDKNQWIVIDQQGTVTTLEKEIYRLNAIANKMQQINFKIKKDYDSLLKVKATTKKSIQYEPSGYIINK